MKASRTQILIGVALLFLGGADLAAQEVSQSLTFDGRAFGNSEATVPMLDLITTKVQILNSAQDCVLYEETQTLDTRSTNGYFSIQIGSAVSATKRSGYDSNHGMSKVFANASAIAGKLVSDGSACNYIPAGGDKRYVRIQMTPSGDGITRSISPNMALDSVPTAMVAETVQGYAPTDFVQIKTSGSAVVTQANLESIFSTTNFPSLLNLLSVAPTSYVRTGTNGSAALPSVAGNPASGLAVGQIWYDSLNNVVKYYDGTTKTIGSTTGATGTYVNGGNSFAAAASIGTNDNNTLAIKTNNVARMTFDTSGNVVIGTTTAVGKFHVEGGTAAYSSYVKGSGQNVAYIEGSGASSYATLAVSNTSNRDVASLEADSAKISGRMMSIATGNATFAGTALEMNMGRNGGGNFTGKFLDFINSGGTGGYAGPTMFSVASDGTMYTAGKVGIGLANPSEILTIKKDQNALTTVLVENVSTGATAEATFKAISNAGAVHFGINGTNAGSSGAAYVWNNANTGLLFATNDTERMMISNTGSVGINTYNPKGGLDIATTGTASSIVVPRDTTANRPTAPENGMIRYNTTNKNFEGYQDGAWQGVQAANVMCSSAAQSGSAGVGVGCVRLSDGNVCFQTLGAPNWTCGTAAGWPGTGNWQCSASYSTGYVLTCSRVTDGQTCYHVFGIPSWTCSTATGWAL